MKNKENLLFNKMVGLWGDYANWNKIKTDTEWYYLCVESKKLSIQMCQINQLYVLNTHNACQLYINEAGKETRPPHTRFVRTVPWSPDCSISPWSLLLTFPHTETLVLLFSSVLESFPIRAGKSFLFLPQNPGVHLCHTEFILSCPFFYFILLCCPSD